MKKYEEKYTSDPGSYQRTEMQKQMIIQKLRDKGGRVTRQRRLLLDIILEEECSCCKEIYYKAVSKDAKIGLATVYRMINTLEEIGAISRQNMYKVVCGEECMPAEYAAEFEDGTVTELSAEAWYEIVSAGLRSCGYMQGRELRSVRTRSDEYSDK